jgi:inorganic pyrophosphatase
MNLLKLPIGAKSPEIVNTIVEIPGGGVNKYEYDKKLHVFRLDRRLYSPVHYPFDYGFIPSTLALDGDPMDVLIMGDEPTFTGCLVAARPIGLLDMLDQDVHDEKILAVASSHPRYMEVKEYTDIYPHVLKEIEHFFTIYKDLEGKRVKTVGWRDLKAAQQTITESHERFLQGLKHEQVHF